MSALTLSPSRKRPHTDDTTPSNDGPIPEAMQTSAVSDAASTPLSSARSQSDMGEVQTTVSNSATAIVPQGSATKKRRKLTAEEKEQQRLDREAKDKAKQERKEKAEEEKRIKDKAAAERREQAEEKKRAKEQEQARKDQEKAKREEERAKKERSQLRLNAFFSKPKSTQDAPAGTSLTPQKSADSNERRKSLSLEPDRSTRGSAPPSPSPVAIRTASARNSFLPFQVNKDVSMAPWRLSSMTSAQIDTARDMLDSIISDDRHSTEVPTLIAEFKSRTKPHGVSGIQLPSVKSLVDLLSGTADHPVDLTSDPAAPTEREALDWLGLIPTKYLHFYEDVRPPYCGTFTKSMERSQCRRLARNFARPELPEVNYEYDSEAEWEEPEEGEEIFSEMGDKDRDELEDEDEEDLEGFLDDDEDVELKRRQVSGDLEPVSSGIVWENIHGVSMYADGTKATDFGEFRMQCLLGSTPRSIDPFSTAYWTQEPTSTTSNVSHTTGMTAMNPPRLPLSVRADGMNTLNIPNVVHKNPKIASVLGTKPKLADVQKRMVPENILLEFKAVVNGSDLTKIGLIEHLKKQFPKVPKDAITNTLGAVAQRVGKTAAEKRWELK